MSEIISKNFEIHTGFSKEEINSSSKLDESWSRLLADKVLLAQGSGMCFKEHNVPGKLAALYTKRFSSIEKAIGELENQGKLFQGHHDVRFELEEVLHTSENLNNLEIKPATEFSPNADDFKNLILIKDAPLFEMHFSIKRKDSLAMSESMQDIVDIAMSIGVDIHEVVCFEYGKKITTTTFFSSFEEMNEFFSTSCNKFNFALAKYDQNISIKQIAERIIFCAQPTYK